MGGRSSEQPNPRSKSIALTAARDFLRPWTQGMRVEAVANLAHELRSPLQVLLGYLDILREEWVATLAAEPREMLERMNVNLHDLTQTVDNLMEFVTAGADATVRVQEDVSITSLLNDLTPAIEAAKSGKALVLNFELEDAPPVLHISRRLVRSILSNLVLNAIKFTERGSVRVKISSALAPGGAEPGVDIEVVDTGTGISSRLIKQAAEPFAQLSHSNARKYRGLGLGLAVVHRNVKALGAKLEVSSAPGRGSRFVVRIPPAQLAEAQTAAKRSDSRMGVDKHARAAIPPPSTTPHRKTAGSTAEPIVFT